MRIRDLLVGAQARAVGGIEDTYLLEQDSLQEVELVDAWLDLPWSTLALLVDLRGALQLDEGSAGLILLSGVRNLNWQFPGDRWNPMPRLIVSSAFEIGERVTASLGMISGGGDIELQAQRCSFWTGDIPGLPEVRPPYGEASRQEIDRDTPAWDSEFVPLRWAEVVGKS
ncbi:hypothetical protein [Actinokineospora cianjurensis]|uniref:Immunity protein 50 of polymorphic toxin system n=1 Tax=Actinokineospora cianjurensis TaxID=585224 RepID=A0A421B6K0_9PSEU|nr:hypothetical protein [Actinokineospora cianjurensis]RLK60071.1 hypothetical protein CLV68_0568 [Actinokineospora cianjurensis]